MRKLVELSVKYPRSMIAAVAAMTVIMGLIIAVTFSVEKNPSKSFSRDLDVVKFYNLTMKKFTTREVVLIGVENDKDGVFNVETLRYIEQLTNKVKNLSIQKKYKSIITGKKEKVAISADISTDGIISAISMQDVTVDKNTNTIIMGKLTGKARTRAGLIDADSKKMEELPENDQDLRTLIPYLKIELRANPLLRGTIISADEKACAIVIPVGKAVDKKLEILRKELYTMIDAGKLRQRFKGEDIFYFPHDLYNKKVDGITINDEYIDGLAEKNRKNIKSFIVSYFKEVRKGYIKQYGTLKNSEVNEAYLDQVFALIATDGIYNMKNHAYAYGDLVDDMYRYLVAHLDRFSIDNLESKLYSVKDIYDMGNVYDVIERMTNENKPEGIATYIAGQAVAEALIQRFIVGDMSVLLIFSVLVKIGILFLSFKTARGIILPLAGVAIATDWVMGLFLIFGFRLSAGTIALPTILIALGSVYIIYFISKFFEETLHGGITDKAQAILKTHDNVVMAINLSAITAIGAFLSTIYSAGVIDIKVLGILSALGIFFTALMTYTFTPAMLMLFPFPQARPESRPERMLSEGIMLLGKFTYNHYQQVFIAALIIAVVGCFGIFKLRTESSLTGFFGKDNPIRISCSFIDRKLTGTGQMNIVFKMRDKVNLSSSEAQNDLRGRIEGYLTAYKTLLQSNPALNISPSMNNYFQKEIASLKNSMAENQDILEEKCRIMSDLINDYYTVNTPAEENKKVEQKSDSGAFDFSSLADSSALASSAQNGESPVDKGIKNIIERIGVIKDEQEVQQAKNFITTMRTWKSTPAGEEFVGSFNSMADFFATDFRQPSVLRKIDVLSQKLKAQQEPKADIDGVLVAPVGNTLAITDTLKIIYKVFYHNGDEKFSKIPDVKDDGITDKSLTDRSVISVCLNQFAGADPEMYKSLLTEDGKMLQFMVYTRSDKADFLRGFSDNFNTMVRPLFPKDDPYVENIVISGLPSINMTMNKMLLDQQLSSVLITLGVVFVSCLFIFRSFTGGLLALVPITLTVVMCLGVMGWLDLPINYSTVIVASIAIGAGINFTIHFLDRFRLEYQHLGNSFEESYYSTMRSTGKAIIVSALTVAGGFAVLAASTFKMLAISGLMEAMAMILSSVASITVMPALIKWVDPDFLSSSVPEESLMERFKIKLLINKISGGSDEDQ